MTHINKSSLGSSIIFFECKGVPRPAKNPSELNVSLNWMSVNKINNYIQHCLESILPFIHWVLKPNTENTMLPPVPPTAKFYLLVSLLPPTADRHNYNCGSILSKICSSKRYLKEVNHSGSILTLPIKEQWVHLLKVSRYLLVLKEHSTLTAFSLLDFYFFPQIRRTGLGLARDRNVKPGSSGTILISWFSAPGPPLVLHKHTQSSF